MEKNSLLISVIIPMYNSADTIIRALDSIKNQSYKSDYQIIVVNDGSTDNSCGVVGDYLLKNPDLNIKLVDQVNGGVSIIEFKNYDYNEYDKIIVPAVIDGKKVVQYSDGTTAYAQ